MGIRAVVQNRVIDPLQFRIDRGLRLEYQPLPWLDVAESGRSTGSEERWEMMRPEVARIRPRSVVDIGSNVGYFTLRLAEQGASCLGIEGDSRSVRLATYAARRSGLEVAYLHAMLSPTTMWMVPPSELVLLLSVYHHWIRHLGAEDAASMLATLWERTGRALLFETGESEVPARFNGPDMGDDPRGYLDDHLRSIVGAGPTIRCLGSSKAFVPGEGDERTAPASRHLFLLERA